MSKLRIIRLGLDELEAVRLCDVGGMDQEEAGIHMGISRGTVHRLVKTGRRKVVEAIVESAALVIEKGNDDENLHTNG